MPNHLKKDVLLVGTGYMGKEYVKVLNGHGYSFLAIGRGNKSADAFEEATGAKVLRGGLEKNLELLTENELPASAIVAVNYAELENAATLLMKHGVRHILLEKPGAPSFEGIRRLQCSAREKDAIISLAYNRRYYSSTLAAKKIIEEDGGVVSFNFEFTELKRIVDNLNGLGEAYELFFGNSGHVMDMAFHLGGKPKEMSCYRTGLSFAGSGITEQGALFSYQANWNAPGRWGVEILTRKHRLIFRPLEKLQVQNLGSMQISFVKLDDQIDEQYKPGLYREVEAFMKGDSSGAHLCSLDEQAEDVDFYEKISCGLEKQEEAEECIFRKDI